MLGTEIESFFFLSDCLMPLQRLEKRSLKIALLMIYKIGGVGTSGVPTLLRRKSSEAQRRKKQNFTTKTAAYVGGQEPFPQMCDQ